jgi:hypothetical protein
MARAKWIKSLFAAAVSTSLAMGQSPSSTPAPTKAEKVITVQEVDRPAQKCKVVKVWQLAGGLHAFQVKAIDSGEIITIVEEGPHTTVHLKDEGKKAQAVATRIYHWGKSDTPPAGTPTFADAQLVSTVVVPGPSAPAPTKNTLNPATTKYTVPTTTTTAAPTAVPAMPPVASGYAPNYTTDKPVNQQKVTAAAPAAKKEPEKTTTVAQTPAAPPLTPSAVDLPKPMPSAPKVASAGETKPAPASMPQLSVPALPVTATPTTAAPAVKASTTGAAADTKSSQDWRKSWGQTPSQPTTTQPDVKTVKNDTPKADAQKLDPLQNPASYHVPAGFEKEGTKAQTTKSEPTIEAPPAKSEPKADVQSAKSEPNPELQRKSEPKAESHFTLRTMRAAKTSASDPKKGVTPAGAASMQAADNVEYAPVLPEGLPLVQVPQAPQPNRHMQGPMAPGMEVPPNAFAPSDTIDPDAPKPSRMVNAFTPGRPEPAAGGPGVLATNVPNGNRPSGPGMLPAAPYSGPSFPAGKATAGYQPQPGMMPQAQNPYLAAAGHPQAMKAPATMPLAAATPDTKQMVQTLKDALLPSQRERAAEQLSKCDAKQNPIAVQALAAAAKDDPAPGVRACCVHGLVLMMADSAVIANAVECLKADNDPRVQKAVQQAVASLPRGAQVVQPAGFQMPAK